MKKHLPISLCVAMSIASMSSTNVFAKTSSADLKNNNAAQVSANYSGGDQPFATSTEKRTISDRDISAFVRNGELTVNWSTVTEINCTGFEIEGSYDGINFTSIKAVDTKAEDGNSKSVLSYRESVSTAAMNIALGSSLLAFLGLVGFRGNKKWKIASSLGIAAILVLTACSKSDVAPKDDSKKLYVRVSQLNGDGTKLYSKTVQAVNQ